MNGRSPLAFDLLLHFHFQFHDDDRHHDVTLTLMSSMVSFSPMASLEASRGNFSRQRSEMIEKARQRFQISPLITDKVQGKLGM
jgi:hypothetical protein